ncbi:MAG: methylthioribulose 1-phosphate dehydratase [Phormidesmis sp.]
MLHSANLRESLAWAIADIHNKGTAQGTGGNFSVLGQSDPLRLLMSPSGVDKGTVAPTDLLEIDRAGQVITGKGAASAETLVHLSLVAAGAKAVLHTHSVLGTLLSRRSLEGQLTFSGYEMLKGIEGVKTHEAVVILPIIENSQDMHILSQQVQQLLKDWPNSYAFLVAGHGLYVWGDSLFQARRHLEIFEFLLELTYHDWLLTGKLLAR